MGWGGVGCGGVGSRQMQAARVEALLTRGDGRPDIVSVRRSDFSLF